MAGPIINTQLMPYDLLPLEKTWFGEAYASWPSEYAELGFVEHQMKDAVEFFVKQAGFGMPKIFGEGEGVTFDVMQQRWNQQLRVFKIGLGYIQTMEARQDSIDKVVDGSAARELARGFKEYYEVLCAAYLEAGFSGGTSIGGDGVVLFSNAHPTLAGTYSNIPGVAVALSEAGLEADFKNICNLRNERGLRLRLAPKKLIVSVNNAFEAERVLNSQGQVYTPDNTPNALKNLGMFPGGVFVSKYLTQTSNSYYIQLDHPNPAQGLMFLKRLDPVPESDNVFDSGNMKVKAVARIGVSHVDPLVMYASYNA